LEYLAFTYIPELKACLKLLPLTRLLLYPENTLEVIINST